MVDQPKVYISDGYSGIVGAGTDGGGAVEVYANADDGDCGGDPGPRKGCTEDRMHGTEQRKLAIETYIKFDPSAADTVAELGHPTRHSLRAWYKDCLEHGEVRPPKRQREPKPARSVSASLRLAASAS